MERKGITRTLRKQIQEGVIEPGHAAALLQGDAEDDPVIRRRDGKTPVDRLEVVCAVREVEGLGRHHPVEPVEETYLHFVRAACRDVERPARETEGVSIPGQAAV